MNCKHDTVQAFYEKKKYTPSDSTLISKRPENGH